MLDELPPSSAFAHEGEGGGEDGLAALSGLHRARAEASPFSYVLDVVDDGYVGVAVQHEVAVHAVHCEGRGDGALGRGEALGYGGAAVDSAGAGWVPEGPGVGEEVGLDVAELRQFEDVFDGGFVLRGGWWFD